MNQHHRLTISPKGDPQGHDAAHASLSQIHLSKERLPSPTKIMHRRQPNPQLSLELFSCRLWISEPAAEFAGRRVRGAYLRSPARPVNTPCDVFRRLPFGPSAGSRRDASRGLEPAPQNEPDDAERGDAAGPDRHEPGETPPQRPWPRTRRHRQWYPDESTFPRKTQ